MWGWGKDACELRRLLELPQLIADAFAQVQLPCPMLWTSSMLGVVYGPLLLSASFD